MFKQFQLIQIQIKSTLIYFIIIMIPQNDQEIDTLFSQRVLNPFNMVCGLGNKVLRFCSNDACKNDALCCDQDNCENCQAAHGYCPTLKFKSISTKVEERIALNKKILRNLFSIENELMKKLTENRLQLIESSNFWKLQGRCSKIIQSIYYNNNSEGIKGQDIKILLAQLSQKTKEVEAEQYIAEYRKQTNKFLNSLKIVRQNIIQGIIKSRKSKILSEDEQGWKKYSLLMKQLNNPSHFKLLFRASQHNFSAAKFHEICDDISDTVTIVRTEFHKTIAAYTPLKWKATSGYQYVPDNTKTSFLYQMELKQKMTLTQPDKAILNNQNYGPIFGGGNDLYIADQCNQKQSSCANFPHSYNCNGKYQNNQQSHTAICGSPSGCYFRVVQYEVFAISK